MYLTNVTIWDDVKNVFGFLLENDFFGVLFGITSVILLIWSIYNNIKYECLKKATELIAKVEEQEELTGEEKFALVISWINEDLPILFQNTFIKSLTIKIAENVFENVSDYAKKYIKRKTGYDISDLIDILKDVIVDDNKDNNKSETSKEETDDKKENV